MKYYSYYWMVRSVGTGHVLTTGTDGSIVGKIAYHIVVVHVSCQWAYQVTTVPSALWPLHEIHICSKL